MLKVEDVHINYGGVRALDGVSIDVPWGAITTVIGSNGAGKTSLMKTIAGLVPPSSGAVSIDGEVLDGLAPSGIVARGIALVPEGRELFPRMSIRENLLVGASLVKDRASRARTMDQVYSLFPVLARKSGAYASQLSGGEQQMLAFGRALMAQPKVLLLDEPSIGLAPLIEEQLMASVRHIASEMNVAVLLVEQNAMLALENADWAYVMELGRLTKNGPASELLDDPHIISAYLGG